MRQRNTIAVGRIFGIPIGLDYSWFLIVGLLTFSLATGYFPEHYAAWPTALYWLVGGAATIMLFASVLLHELGHSVVAMGYKVPVRRIRLMIFGGVAELVDEPPSAAGEFFIAIAGPVVSFVLAGLFFAVFTVLQVVSGGGRLLPLEALAGLSGYLALINLMLGLFNLVPGFPLDGGRVLRAIIWGIGRDLRRATLIAANVGRIVSVGFIALGVWRALGGNLSNGLWTIFIGIFLQQAADAEVRMRRVRDLLSGQRVSQVMRPATYMGLPLAVPTGSVETLQPDTGLWAALRKMDLYGTNQLPVVEGGRVLGVLRRDDVFSFMRGRWAVRGCC